MTTSLNRHKRPMRQSGFAMLIVISVTTLMLTIATICINLALDEKVMASAVSYSQRSMTLAEAGVKWAEIALPELLFPNGAGAQMELNALLALPKLAPNDSMCHPWDDCSRYRLLTQNGPVPFGGGTYRVGVTCYPDACTKTPTGFEVRSEGALEGDIKAVVEVGYTF